MCASAILMIDIACPNCGRVNSLTLGDVDARRIACSNCRSVLGAGRELAAQRCAPPPPHFRAEECVGVP